MSRLKGLDPIEYEHPEDREALDKLEALQVQAKYAWRHLDTQPPLRFLIAAARVTLEFVVAAHQLSF